MRVNYRPPFFGRLLFSPDENPGTTPPAAPPAGDPPAPTNPPAPDPAATPPAAKPATLMGDPANPPAPAEPPKEGDAPKDAPPAAPAVPDKYELSLPENSPLDPQAIDRISSFARENGLSQEQAAKALEFHNSEVAERDRLFLESNRPGGAEWIAKTTAWQEQGIADPEIGGSLDNLKKSASQAAAVVKRFFGDDVLGFLEETGLGSNPGVIKGFVKFARAVSEGGAPPRDAAPPSDPTPKTAAATLYPNLPSEHPPSGAKP